MKVRNELRPDLNDCVLEDRALMAGWVWTPMPFMPINASNNSIVVSGFNLGGGPSGGGVVNPGSNAYYLRMGINTNIYGLVGQSSVVVPSGYALSLSYNTPFGAGPANTLSVTVGSGANSGGGSSSGITSAVAQGNTFNQGYGNSLNNGSTYGLSTSPVGSVPVHSYGGDNSAPAAPATP